VEGGGKVFVAVAKGVVIWRFAGGPIIFRAGRSLAQTFVQYPKSRNTIGPPAV
jgi:glucose-6-phosphate 1-dehydrogenase